MNPLYITDGYKLGHHPMLPENLQNLFTACTPRKSRLPFVKELVWFGFQFGLIKYLKEDMNTYFFSIDKDKAVGEYKRYLDLFLGADVVGVDDIAALHDKGFLPLEIRSIPEGTPVPIGIPTFTIEATDPNFAWLVNRMESLLSCFSWGPATVATISREYRKILNFWGNHTNSEMSSIIPYQAHDFSLRGMMMPEAATIASGLGHLLFNEGTDTFPALMAMEKYYGADLDLYPPRTIPAMEHMIMCVGKEEMEVETVKRILTEVYPTGPVSIIADTWNLWQFITEHARTLKEVILARNGKTIFRPDSSWTSPTDVLCGMDVFHRNTYNLTKPEQIKAASRGVVATLDEIFGHTMTPEGFKQLNDKVGVVYGDAITMEVCSDICQRLAAAQYASTNLAFGVGSYSYQYNTRDTFGMALKATAAIVGDEVRLIHKDPVTSLGEKKSAKGYQLVSWVDNRLVLKDNLDNIQYRLLKGTGRDAFVTVFKDGEVFTQSWEQVKDNALKTLPVMEKVS